jgi:hypothetical protein
MSKPIRPKYISRLARPCYAKEEVSVLLINSTDIGAYVLLAEKEHIVKRVR